MKKLLYQLSALLFVGSLISCEKDLMTYEGESNVYFEEAGGAMDVRLAKDSTGFSFAPIINKDSVVKVVISTVGTPVNYDREYKMEIDPSSTAVLGTHFEFPADQKFVIKKNAIHDTVRVRLIRTPDMLDKELNIIFNLVPNENFNTLFKQRLNSQNKPVSCITKKLMVTDGLLKPRNWSINYFGNFTKTKMFLVCELCGVTPLYMDTMSTAEGLFYARTTQRYLNEQAAKGNIIKDEDGKNMVMGSNAQ
ncbi:DUF4843 domain-containing protein [Solitalea koreensis]|uniref:DUF4843 domain-containing protein n=1 Tax=Solitalea koreensis TaxID=543615 RepID=A0A521CA04_9SPHI|nr:DUF4843 domain-containing protein [Solitalea koreensis]SMO56302.1 protein of unknown function [Solitalea koreensis]